MLQPKIDFAELRARTLTLPDDRARAIELSVEARLARHVARGRVFRAGGGLAVAAALLFAATRFAPGPKPVAVAPAPIVAPVTPVVGAPDFGGLVMPDGTRVTFLAAGTQLTQTEGRTSTLVRGAARFDVVHDARSPFRLSAGAIVVEDLGTVFTVGLAEGAAPTVRVAVESGSVSVRGSGPERTLEAGDSAEFSATTAASGASGAEPPRPRAVAKPSWKKLAQAGDYERAFASMQAPGSVHDDPEELLLAADAARLSGHVDRAVPLLRRLVAEFPSDTRGGLAAFTLGRVLLDDLDEPRDAAAAFATAYGYGGPLAEDALARQAEALARSGDRAAAAVAGARYLAVYPNGRRAALVRRVTSPP